MPWRTPARGLAKALRQLFPGVKSLIIKGRHRQAAGRLKMVKIFLFQSRAKGVYSGFKTRMRTCLWPYDKVKQRRQAFF